MTSSTALPTPSVRSHRPPVSGLRHVVAAGHSGAAHAAFSVLEAGGNAIDAGVAAGIALGVLQPDIVNVAGVAPILIYRADRDEVVSIAGLGTWPTATSLEYFTREHGGRIPPGLRRTVVPAAPATWIRALQQFGTRSFAEVAAPSIAFARDGFAAHPLLLENVTKNEAGYRTWPSNAAIFLPGGKIPRLGDLFFQADLARTLQFMCDEEKRAAGGGRVAGLQAAADAFYRGDIASTISRFHVENDGWLSMEDLAGFDPEIAPALHVRFRDYDLYTCPPWCQGPVLAQACRLLEPFDLKSLKHNSSAYVHLLVEALKIAFGDRERHYGDPRFVAPFMDALLDPAYLDRRRNEISADRAAVPPDSPGAFLGELASADQPDEISALDTSYVCVVDGDGNVFSATPSDTSHDAPVIPGTGLVPSTRGSQSWTDPAHPSVLAPGKRPRLTPNPALALRRRADGRRELLPFGSPGGDVQVQAMLQVFLNVVEFGMDVQSAVESPRFGTFSFPTSFEPHVYKPGQLNIEARFPDETIEKLVQSGHVVEVWPEWSSRAGGVCLIRTDPETGLKHAGADPRRPSYALGW